VLLVIEKVTSSAADSDGETPLYLAFAKLSESCLKPYKTRSCVRGWLAWRLNPRFTAATIGGVSLAVLCRSRALALDDGSVST